MVTITNSAGPNLDVSAEFFAAVASRAEFHADLVGRYLTQTSGLTGGRFPAAFLLELAALLQIGVWERQRVFQHVETDLPSYKVASATLAARARRGPQEFRVIESATLSAHVFRVSVRQLAWQGPELLAAEVAVDTDEEDELIDLLAEFVWNNRAELAHLINGST